MPKPAGTHSIDHPKVHEAGFQAPSRRLSTMPSPDPDLGLLRAARDRLPRKG